MCACLCLKLGLGLGILTVVIARLDDKLMTWCQVDYHKAG